MVANNNISEEERVRWAKEALSNPLLLESFKQLKETYMRAAGDCDLRDDIGRSRFVQAWKDTEAVELHLKAVLQSGVVPEEAEKEFATRRKVVGITIPKW